jgi:arylsulfatase A-like enzyme
MGLTQGLERTDIRFSTGQLRQCKASVFEGGLRVPGMIHYPDGIKSNINHSMPVGTVDFLPTIMDLLQVKESSNPGWILDGMSLVPTFSSDSDPAGSVQQRRAPDKALGFSWGHNRDGSTGDKTQVGLIDNDLKIMRNPAKGQCDMQPPYDPASLLNATLLFDLSTDPHELHDLKEARPEEFKRMSEMLDDFLASINYSQEHETHCRVKQ